MYFSFGRTIHTQTNKHINVDKDGLSVANFLWYF